MMWYTTKRYLHLLFWFWGPVLAAIIVMYFASDQPKYSPPDENMTVYFSGAMPVFSGILEVLIKKSGHVLAFGVLAILAMRALIAGGMCAQQAGYVAVVLTVGYALFDEFHQSFTPGRSPSGLDIGLDFVGAALFTLIARRSYPEHADTLPESPPPHEPDQGQLW
ncbi:MAG: VanZ family protein [Anaerolineae bacterium]|nr:VanZ family protein [Anaerolineae bacterium]